MQPGEGDKLEDEASFSQIPDEATQLRLREPFPEPVERRGEVIDEELVCVRAVGTGESFSDRFREPGGLRDVGLFRLEPE